MPHDHTEDTTEEKVEKATTSIAVSLKTLSTLATGAVAILGAVWAFDSHYASAADVEKIQRNVNAQFAQQRIDTTEDELFKLDAKKQLQGGKLDPIDQALYERYSRRLQQVQVEQKQLRSETK